MKVAIQGIRGSFHDIAAHEFFSGQELDLICCNTFEDLFAAMKADDQVLGLMAIENTIAGSLLHNYELLRESGMTIIGEHKLHIEHALLCLPDEDWGDIVEVNSHPVALAQCRQFLQHHPKMKVVEVDDTAGAAQAISSGHLRGHAAICHEGAAPLHRGQQAQLHPLPGPLRRMERRPPARTPHHQQGQHRLHPAPRGGLALAGAIHLLVLQD